MLNDWKGSFLILITAQGHLHLRVVQANHVIWKVFRKIHLKWVSHSQKYRNGDSLRTITPSVSSISGILECNCCMCVCGLLCGSFEVSWHNRQLHTDCWERQKSAGQNGAAVGMPCLSVDIKRRHGWILDFGVPKQWQARILSGWFQWFPVIEKCCVFKSCRWNVLSITHFN